MIMPWYEKVTGPIEDKKRYRAHRSRMRALPDGYREAGAALERYLMYAGGVTQGHVAAQMLDDLADLLEQSAANGTPIRAIVGDNPLEFIDDFVRNYAHASWLAKEQARLVGAIDKAAESAASA